MNRIKNDFMMFLDDIEGKTAVVTGASQGIGKAVVLALLQQKATVFGLDRNEATIENSNYQHIQCNLSMAGEIETSFSRIAQQASRIDYLVNVAGIDPVIPIEMGDHNSWNDIVNLNLRGYYLCIRSGLQLLRQGSGRSIVNISSINYRLGVNGRSIYSATKEGIIGLTTGIARELGKEDIRINCISPGWIFTERQKSEYFETANKEGDEKYFSTLFSNQSLRITIQPEDIANHVLFLLSKSSRATTGHNMVVDGGWLLE